MAFRKFVESPVTALVAGGVPIRPEDLTKHDLDRLIDVMANLRRLTYGDVWTGPFVFEDVFDVLTPENCDPYQNRETEQEIGCNTSFDDDCETHSSTNNSVSTTWGGIRPQWEIIDGILMGPLYSPGDLASLVTYMHEGIRALKIPPR